ncbi:MAG: UDP-N-acetylmuramoyl-tripeptide--D-alanyl-D-alanine ligase [Gammaproteobacteria bacterium]|nr:UDP-N-acetylmuramoyl-tripeptide--D-alanyl-D-alanine ligase [Gammaproteobacteria bacterium]
MMRNLGLAEVARFLGVAQPARDVAFNGVSTDSRSITAGQLFVALSGERFDGHAFAGEAERRGAAALLGEHETDTQLPCLQAPDTRLALGQIARLNRQLFHGTVIALTGSAGKTTTKEMIAAILGRGASVLATRGNLNNEIGVPLTLLGLTPAIRYAVIEMGAARPGDIRYLAGLAEPDVALLTNALPAHLEGFGSIEAVAETKGEIYDALAPAGTAVLNIDDRFADRWLTRIGSRRVVRVSARGLAGADVRASDVRIVDGCAQLSLEMPGGQISVRLQVPGVQQVANAVAAAGVACALGIATKLVKEGLESLCPVAGRMERLKSRSGCLLINDTYNANPGSMRAAIETLATFAGTRVLVMGHMAELGAGAGRLHHEAGVCAREHAIEHLLVTGAHAGAVAEGYGAAARVFAARDALALACAQFDRPGVVMLVKGSRSAGMEAVVEALLGSTAPNTPARVH